MRKIRELMGWLAIGNLPRCLATLALGATMTVGSSGCAAQDGTPADPRPRGTIVIGGEVYQENGMVLISDNSISERYREASPENSFFRNLPTDYRQIATDAGNAAARAQQAAQQPGVVSAGQIDVRAIYFNLAQIERSNIGNGTNYIAESQRYLAIGRLYELGAALPDGALAKAVILKTASRLAENSIPVARFVESQTPGDPGEEGRVRRDAGDRARAFVGTGVRINRNKGSDDAGFERVTVGSGNVADGAQGVEARRAVDEIIVNLASLEISAIVQSQQVIPQLPLSEQAARDLRRQINTLGGYNVNSPASMTLAQMVGSSLCAQTQIGAVDPNAALTNIRAITNVAIAQGRAAIARAVEVSRTNSRSGFAFGASEPVKALDRMIQGGNIAPRQRSPEIDGGGLGLR